MKPIAITAFVVALAILMYFSLPMEFHNRSEISRGDELIELIDNYYILNSRIPEYGEWEVLEEIGFAENELNISYPEYQKVNDSTYQLIFVLGFDPPYLMWNSIERKWKVDLPTIPDNLKRESKD